MMVKRIRTRNRGLSTVPGLYNGYDVLHHSMKKTINGEHLPSGLYDAVVVHVKISSTPGVPYKVMAWLPELSPTVQPGITHDPKQLRLEQIIGLKYYEPLDGNLEQPLPGQVIQIMMTDTKNSIGKYVGTSGDVPPPTLEQTQNAKGAKQAIENKKNGITVEETREQMSIESSQDMSYSDSADTARQVLEESSPEEMSMSITEEQVADLQSASE